METCMLFERIKWLDDYLFDSKYGFENMTRKIQKLVGIDCIDQSRSVFLLALTHILFVVNNNIEDGAIIFPPIFLTIFLFYWKYS